ncbi:MAG: thermonuclease family protein [Nitrospirota bacterium]|nr:thermonuclease family protein [Nitrospirota bacterium]
MRSIIMLVSVLIFGGPTVPARAETFGPFTAEVIRVLDGDTLEMRLYIAEGLMATDIFRLDGVDTPEMHDPLPCVRAKAVAARNFVAAWTAARGLRVETLGRDKYGRQLARVTRGLESLTDTLIDEGHARAYSGGKRLPWAC